MDLYLIALRLIHIFTGAFWAGAAIYLAVFILPAAKALGPEGGKFMQQLSGTRNLPMVIFWNGTLNVLSGFLMLWYFSDGFSNDWLGTHMGIVLCIGGTLAFSAYLVSLFITRPVVAKIAAIGAAAKGQPLTQEQIQSMNKLRAKLTMATNLIAWLVSGTVIMMSVARYI